ncbi:MAG: sigma-70 family RNA polymerase sigma factor [Armatimonadetes bacterium]|nr:sigma-70 family RNA polymerase sigma factor [Armatimonadota bacterium]MDE2205109.1 sigma-70 family RNA polymerase sigma factor [Armatimonadota bacterium]
MVAMGKLMVADAALVKRAQANDRAAFNDIVLRYKARVYNYVYRMVHSATEAEDLTQETFVKAYLSIGSFQSRASLNTWLYRIATNVCIDFSRRNQKLQNTVSLSAETEADDDERELPDATFDPQRLALNRELGDRLDLALQGLPEKLRTVVLLYDVEGLAYDEIAGILGCPLGTVKSRLFNARASLRERLSPYLMA